ncbi:unnamed protein product [Chondrus crispus]|uniref:Uncharacterized protein n=1 Tax=Chondrus crispus TaxID=2769 RepID=R7Q7Q0_CHOCR|nr:unnamed protein product [Chondrus crispus]CDF33475.1 unnamed protein product [Chondrus crispus]|eukprot:XP_005713278.1 unnamed protein product [Chondrus crispus]
MNAVVVGSRLQTVGDSHLYAAKQEPKRRDGCISESLLIRILNTVVKKRFYAPTSSTASPPALLFLISDSKKNSPARYELLTSGPAATYEKPIASPSTFHASNSSGVTHCSTFKCFFDGLKYWPRVITSTPTSRASCMVRRISASASPTPSMMLVFVTTCGRTSRARSRTRIVWAYPARRSRTNGCKRSTVSTLWAKTSRPDVTTRSTQSSSPAKSGDSVSTSKSGCSLLSAWTVLAM